MDRPSHSDAEGSENALDDLRGNAKRLDCLASYVVEVESGTGTFVTTRMPVEIRI